MNRQRIYALIEPSTKGDAFMQRFYDYAMLLAILLGIFPLMFRHEAAWMEVADTVACTAFIIDYCLRWITVDKRPGSKSAWAFVTYPFTPMAIMDLLSILPSFTAVNASFRLLRMARFLKILRLVRVIRYYPPLVMMLSVLRKERATLLTVLTFAAFYIFITALIMFNAEIEVNPETGEEVFATFFDSLYWAACTLTTVGYGDICPVSWVGRLISMFSAIMGVAIIALPSGIITASYLEELKEWKARKSRAKQK